VAGLIAMRTYRSLWLALLALVLVGLGSVIVDRWYVASKNAPVPTPGPTLMPTVTPTPMAPIEDIG
jgi:hypothetical protein